MLGFPPRLAGRLGAAALATLATLDAARAEVYRCEQNGAIRYTDRPCTTGAQAVDLPDPIVLPAGPKEDFLDESRKRDQAKREARDRTDAEWLEEHEEQKEDEERLRSARNAGNVVEGMKPDDVRRLHGEPAVVSHSRSKNGDRETWSYVLGDGRRLHVTFVDGEVSAVRTRKEKK
ncbi:MAG: DUF4124 domain-containing protein [Sinimarinibacterium sp.]|jgi:hypothetical protein